MKTSKLAHLVLLPALFATSLLCASAQAQVHFNITVGPPAPQHEVIPSVAPGYVWTPGYWAWHGDRHIWVRGRTIVQRPGYRWEPDRWEQRNSVYYRYPGAWMVEEESQSLHSKKTKKPKKVKHRKDED